MVRGGLFLCRYSWFRVSYVIGINTSIGVTIISLVHFLYFHIPYLNIRMVTFQSLTELKI